MTSPTSLPAFRRARELREQRKGLALAVQAEPNAVRIILGNEKDGAELGIDPDMAECIGLEILAASKAAREAK